MDFGKIRVFMMGSWAVMALATTTMCTWGAGHLSGFAGLVFFIVCYLVYIIGYTMVNVSTNITGNVMTNDPGQRPILSGWSTIYSYLFPMIISTTAMSVLLPRYNNEIGGPFLSALNLLVVVLSLVLYLLACVGIIPYDKPENFAGISVSGQKNQSISVKDMIALIKDNKELQRYMIAACSDKLARTVSGASVITTMLYGILIGNMGISASISAVAMLPSIVFAIVGARLAGKKGNKEVMVQWTWVSIVLYALMAAFLMFSDIRRITVAAIPTAIFFLFMFAARPSTWWFPPLPPRCAWISWTTSCTAAAAICRRLFLPRIASWTS